MLRRIPRAPGFRTGSAYRTWGPRPVDVVNEVDWTASIGRDTAGAAELLGGNMAARPAMDTTRFLSVDEAAELLSISKRTSSDPTSLPAQDVDGCSMKSLFNFEKSTCVGASRRFTSCLPDHSRLHMLRHHQSPDPALLRTLGCSTRSLRTRAQRPPRQPSPSAADIQFP
jgi:hypothetical protein